MTPLIQDYSTGIDNHEETLRNEEQILEDNTRDKEAEGNTPAMQEGVRNAFNMGEFSEGDNDRIKEIRKLEALDNDGENIIESVIDTSSNHENINKEQEKQNEIALDKFKDNPSYPILERFMNIETGEGRKMQLLTEGDLLQLSEVIASGDNIIDSLKDGIKNIEFDDEKTQYVLSNYLDTVEGINDTKKVDGEGMYSVPEDFKGEEYEILSENVDNQTIQLLIKNYIVFPDGEKGEPNIKKDINTAFEITLNKIIENKNFPQTEIYDQAVYDIRNGDLESRIAGLEYVNSLVNTQEGMKGGKAKASFKKITLEQYQLNKTKYIDFKIEQIKKIIDNTSDIKEKEKLEGDITDLEETKNKDDFEGDVFSGDIELEGIKEKSTETKEATT